MINAAPTTPVTEMTIEAGNTGSTLTRRLTALGPSGAGANETGATAVTVTEAARPPGESPTAGPAERRSVRLSSNDQ